MFEKTKNKVCLTILADGMQAKLYEAKTAEQMLSMIEPKYRCNNVRIFEYYGEKIHLDKVYKVMTFLEQRCTANYYLDADVEKDQIEIDDYLKGMMV